MRQLHTANQKAPTRRDFEELKRKVDSLLATNGRRPAGPPATQAQINHEIKRQLAPLLVDLQEAGFDTREVQANIEQLTTNASGNHWADDLAPSGGCDYLSHELPGSDSVDDLAPDDKPTTNAASGGGLSFKLPE